MSIDMYSYPACLGTLVIDWINRRYTFAGMTGDDEMTITEVQATLAQHASSFGVKALGLIFWPENEQLAVHDAESFAAELAHDREVKVTDDDDDVESGSHDDDEICQIAIDQYSSNEINIDNGAIVSVGNDGAWVAAWVFVSKDDIPGWDQDSEENPDA